MNKTFFTIILTAEGSTHKLLGPSFSRALNDRLKHIVELEKFFKRQEVNL